MTKNELITYENKKHKLRIKAIEALPNNAEELDFRYVVTFDNIGKLHKEISFKDLKSELHNLRKYYGDYKITNYWIPYKGIVCVDYSFKDLIIWFSISTYNEQEIISKLSNNKCNIEETISYGIVCNIS